MEVENLEYAPWYKVSDLFPALKAIRKINFSITEQRQQSLERLGNLNDDAPFSKDFRFAHNGTYVCEAEGDWARKFQQLKAALSYKDYSKDDKLNPVPKGGQSTMGAPSENKPLDFNDSQMAFWNSTTSMFDQLRRADGVFNRAVFEQKFGLHWGGFEKTPGKGYSRLSATSWVRTRTRKETEEEDDGSEVSEELEQEKSEFVPSSSFSFGRSDEKKRGTGETEAKHTGE
jgi:hypothetical protein